MFHELEKDSEALSKLADVRGDAENKDIFECLVNFLYLFIFSK